MTASTTPAAPAVPGPATCWAAPGWQACMVIPYVEVTWRGPVFENEHDAMRAAVEHAKGLAS